MMASCNLEGWFLKILDNHWSKCLNIVPRIREEVIVRQLSRGATVSKTTIAETRTLKSARSVAFSKDGHVQIVGVCGTADDSVRAGTVVIHAKVKASMKQHNYRVFMALMENGEILQAFCECPAGQGGGCNHVAALLFELEKYQRSGVLEIHPKPTCTQLPCTWKGPAQKRTAPATWDELQVLKHDIGVEKCSRRTLNSLRFDPRHPDDRNEPITAGLHKDILSVEPLLPFCRYAVPLLAVPDPDPPADEVADHLGPRPVSIHTIREACQKLKTSLNVSQAESDVIEAETRKQSCSEEWFKHRKFRLTSSVMHRVYVMRMSTNPKTFLAQKLYCSERLQTKEMKLGIEREEGAAQRYKLIRDMKENEDITLLRSGLRVSTKHGFLAASTDRLAINRSGTVRLLEVKNPANCWDATNMEDICQKQSCLQIDPSTSSITLNRKHAYYTQIQCQMYSYEVPECDFVLCTKSFMHVETVMADFSFMQKLIYKAAGFFDNIFLPEIVFPRVKYNLDPIDLRTC